MDIEETSTSLDEYEEQIRKKICDDYRNGRTFQQLAGSTGYHIESVRKIWKNFKDRKSYKKDKSGGAPPCLGPSDKIRIINCIRANPQYSCRDIGTHLELNCCPKTICRYLESKGYRNRLAPKKPKLDENDENNRLLWAQNHLHFNFSNVIFADETSIWLGGMWTKFWLRDEDERTFECEAHPEKVHVWAAISLKGKIGIEVFVDNLTADRLVTIYESSLLKAANKAHGKGQWILAQDNDPKHRALPTQKFLKDQGIAVLPWPSYSPDLNPIENIWAVLKRQVSKKKSKTQEELKKNIQKAWDEISTDSITHAVASMKNRLADVIESGGKAINY
jgi:transposase